MGIYKEGRDEAAEESQKIGKTCISCLWSFVVSMTGGLMLGFWEYEYHPTNSQLWMVPFGLILFVTPVIVWFAVLVSEICICNSKEEHDRMASRSVCSLAKESQKTGKTCIAFLWSFVVSMTWGLMLGFGEYKYHPTNSQLWVVPFGLILSVTPVIVWFAVLVSEICICNSEEEHVPDGKSGRLLVR